VPRMWVFWHFHTSPLALIAANVWILTSVV